MAKKAKPTKSSHSGVVPPVINDINPKTFVDGDTYNIGATLSNFPDNSIVSAYFGYGVPPGTTASFSNTSSATKVPSPKNPQQVLFLNSTFKYTGSIPANAALTVTVMTNGGAYTKNVTVSFSPKRFGTR